MVTNPQVIITNSVAPLTLYPFYMAHTLVLWHMYSVVQHKRSLTLFSTATNTHFQPKKADKPTAPCVQHKKADRQIEQLAWEGSSLAAGDRIFVKNVVLCLMFNLHEMILSLRLPACYGALLPSSGQKLINAF